MLLLVASFFGGNRRVVLLRGEPVRSLTIFFGCMSVSSFRDPFWLLHGDSDEFEDQAWDPYSDVVAMKAFQRTERAVKKVLETFGRAQDLCWRRR